MLTFFHDHTQQIRDGVISLFTGNFVAFAISEGPTLFTLAKGAGFSILVGIAIKAFEIGYGEFKAWRLGKESIFTKRK